MEGIRVKGTRLEETFPAASRGAPNKAIAAREVATDPEMDVVVEIDGADPLFGNFEMRLSSLSGGGQSKVLFEIPKGYGDKDMTPPAVPADLHQ
jgi:hypothetical protein